MRPGDDQQARIEAFELKDSAVAARCEFVGVDMFEAVPAGGGTYLMKLIIADWSDAEAIQILRNCRQAMTNSGKILVCDAVITPSNTPDPAKWADFNMLDRGPRYRKAKPADAAQPGEHRATAAGVTAICVKIIGDPRLGVL